MGWIKSLVISILVKIGSHWAPEVLGQLLQEISPDDIARRVRPHVVGLMKKLPPEWRRLYAEALHKLADAIVASIGNLEAGR